MPSNPNSGDRSKDTAVAKTARFVAFSGIALSIIKALIPKPPLPFQPQPQPQPPQPQQPKPSPAPSTPPPTLQPSSKKPAVEERSECRSSSSSARIIEIAKGNTLWGLSRKYGVSINAIKEANRITGDTIYAGKKLIIP